MNYFENLATGETAEVTSTRVEVRQNDHRRCIEEEVYMSDERLTTIEANRGKASVHVKGNCRSWE
jgi:RNase H-fold protein (predicted Holliday junction resolvase)